MPGQPFLFALTIANESPFEGMLADIVARLLGQVGYRAEAVADMLGLLQEVVAHDILPGRVYEARFFTENDELVIVLSHVDGEWRTVRFLPPPD